MEISHQKADIIPLDRLPPQNQKLISPSRKETTNFAANKLIQLLNFLKDKRNLNKSQQSKLP
jgi:hypothetical protein